MTDHSLVSEDRHGHGCQRFRLAIVVSGMQLAGDRRTASARFAAGGVTDDWDRFYDVLISLGRPAQPLAETDLKLVVQRLGAASKDRLVFAIDDRV